MKPNRKLEKAHTKLALEHCNVGLQLDKANARIAELTAEVARYKAALEEIGGDRWVSYMWASDVWHSMQEIARNALRGGV